MKKTLAIIFITTVMLILCACGMGVEPLEPDEAPVEVVVAEGDCFAVYSITGEDCIEKYSYEVRTQDGEVMERVMCLEKPRFAEINKDLVGLRFSANDHIFSRYFDVKNGVISESFKNAFWDNGVLVARHDYANGHYFVVESIFGDDYEYTVKVESLSWLITVLGVETVNDGAAIEVTFVHGDGSDSHEKVDTVVLPVTEEQVNEN